MRGLQSSSHLYNCTDLWLHQRLYGSLLISHHVRPSIKFSLIYLYRSLAASAPIWQFTDITPCSLRGLQSSSHLYTCTDLWLLQLLYGSLLISHHARPSIKFSLIYLYRSLAASAPIWQFTDITPCEAFNQVLTYILVQISGCFSSYMAVY